MATISKGITLSYKTGTAESYTELTNLQEIPDLGGESESIEITTLADAAHTYTNGIKSYGDSLEFVFLYEKTQFTTLNGFGSNTVEWKVTLPDETTCSFSGQASVTLAGVGVNEALTYTLAIRPNSAMTWA